MSRVAVSKGKSAITNRSRLLEGVDVGAPRRAASGTFARATRRRLVATPASSSTMRSGS
jgi:hypothetical protein